MPIETAADRAVFVAADDFGALATYTPAGGVAVPGIAGIFSRPSIEVALDTVTALDAKPTYFCRSADLPDAAAGDAGDALAIEGAGSFEVISLKPDGSGMTLIVLGKA